MQCGCGVIFSADSGCRLVLEGTGQGLDPISNHIDVQREEQLPILVREKRLQEKRRGYMRYMRREAVTRKEKQLQEKRRRYKKREDVIRVEEVI